MINKRFCYNKINFIKQLFGWVPRLTQSTLVIIIVETSFREMK